ncbi:hypothetical protein C8R45DRAFT_964707 [Mycena sanguinolenta]|nr:hypothetical protein C8R45DRAFT_964707 [Mycena sanguinolenta]
MARLPLEISSEIFLQGLDSDTFGRPGPYYAPLLFLNICNTWTTIALSAPALWSTIRIQFPRPGGSLTRQLLPLWLQRAGNHSLSISLRDEFSSVTTHRIPPIVWQHGWHLKELVISHSDDNDEYTYNQENSRILDFFGDTIPESLPLLETLTIRKEVSGREFSTGQILQLLRLAPNLRNCTFGRLSLHLRGYDLRSAERLCLPTLRRLKFGGDSDQLDGYIDILNRLSLPALDTLSLWLNGAVPVVQLLEHSAPPLRELVVDMRPMYSDRLRNCLHLIPTLERLELRGADADFMAEIFGTLADSPSILPVLRVLTLRLFATFKHSPDVLIQMRRAFSVRQTELRIDWTYVENRPAAFVDTLSELVSGGATIHQFELPSSPFAS